MSFQVADALIFAGGTVLLAAIFISVARSARAAPVPYEQIAPAGYRIRRYWFVILLAGAIIALATTLPRFPYASARLAGYGGAQANPLVVKVTGIQWGWLMEPATVNAGRVIRFEVQSRDVNHDFAIYDPDGHIVGQVQAMPGYTNVLIMRFDRAGRYEIRCLELCGQYHHTMVRQFEVTS
jgi:cytochrome c oxidase subunit 2